MAAIIDNRRNSDSLQREPNLKGIGPLPESQWPSYMLRTDRIDKRDNEQGISKLEHYYDRSTESAYKQSHPYDFMFTGGDLKVDEQTLNNNYMRLIFGGKPGPHDNIDLAYNNTIRQMAEAPIEKDSILGHQNPLEFVPGEEATKDSLLRTFAKSRNFYQGAVDSDAERALKTRPTHRLISTTYYGKNQKRYNHVRGQASLLDRPTQLENFKPNENLSSRTYAPTGDGREVPLDYENTNGLDPRAIRVAGDSSKINAPSSAPQAYNFTDTGNYPGREIDRRVFNFADEDPGFTEQFHQFKPRM
jgi:hypothetical protein